MFTENLKGYLLKPANWKKLKTYSKNKFVQKSYVYLLLVPLLVKILSEIQSPLNFMIFGEEIIIIFELPFNLLMFYISSISFTIGLILFRLFVPKIINENDSLADFINERKDRNHIANYAQNLSSRKLNFIFFNKTLNENEIDLFFIYQHNTNSYLIEQIDDFKEEEFISQISSYVISTKSDIRENNEENIEKTFSKVSYFQYLATGNSYVNNREYISLEIALINIFKLKKTMLKYNKMHSQKSEGFFWYLYQISKRKNVFAFYLSYILFLIGFIFIGIVILQSIITVFQYLM